MALRDAALERRGRGVPDEVPDRLAELGGLNPERERERLAEQRARKWMWELLVPIASERRDAISKLAAMAAGMPSVATAVGGVPETITNKVDGLLVEAANPARMAQALRWVLDNQQEAERMGAAARTRMERDFSPTSRTKALFELYRTVLRN